MTGIREIGKPETDPTIVEYLESMFLRMEGIKHLCEELPFPV